MITRHLDSNIIADVGRRSHPLVAERIANMNWDEIAISIIVLGELRVGIEKAESTQEER